jgi:uncharacterized iron-regulated membrane protein
MTMFRQLHRWTSLPLIAFLLLVLATGVALQIEEVIGLGGEAQGGQSRGTALSTEPLTPRQQLDAALAMARKAAPEFSAKRIELSLAPGQQKTRLAVQPRGGPFVEVDHATGKVRAEMNPEMPWHVVFIRLHTGAALGPVGIILMLGASLILLFLAISGGVLYWQMWRNRAERGRRALFWK